MGLKFKADKYWSPDKILPSYELVPQHRGVAGQTYLSLGGRPAATIAILLFSASGLWAQVPTPDTSDRQLNDGAWQQAGNIPASLSAAESQSGKQSAEKKSNEDSEDTCTPKSTGDSEGKQSNRILWVLPNFSAASANTQLPPLSAKGKFWLATQDSFDYSAFVWTGILSGQESVLNNYPEFGMEWPRTAATIGTYS